MILMHDKSAKMILHKGASPICPRDVLVVQVQDNRFQVVATIVKSAVTGVKIEALNFVKNGGEDVASLAEEVHELSSSTEMVPSGKVHMIAVGDDLHGRVHSLLTRVVPQEDRLSQQLRTSSKCD
jgi:hypothetical protein